MRDALCNPCAKVSYHTANLCSETKEEKETKMVNSKETEHEVMGFQVNSKNSNDVVIGIPVRWSYQSAIV